MTLNFSEEQRQGLRRKLTRLFKSEVPETSELRRILSLPRRDWEKDDPHIDLDLPGLVKLLTEYLKTPDGQQVLRPVQAKALQDIHDIGGLFGPIPVGLGKTLISFLAAVVLEAERPLLVIPAKLRSKTALDFEDYKKHWRLHSDFVWVSYEKLSRENGTAFIAERNPDLLIFDECFSAGTNVETPGGVVPIEKLNVGDFVISGDGTSQVVEDIYCRKAGSILELVLGDQRVYCTDNHPFLTTKGWQDAGKLREEDEVVQLVQTSPSENGQESVLFNELLCFLENESTREQSQGVYEGNGEKISKSDEEIYARAPGAGSETFFTDVQQQPHERPQDSKEGIQYAQSDGPLSTSSRGKWKANTRTSSKIGGSAGVGLRTCGGNREIEGVNTEELQNRYCASRTESGCRGGRQKPHKFEGSRSRCSKNKIFRGARLVSVTSIKRRSADEHTGSSRVYNLQVSGSRTYLAEGFVVHNCHRLKNLQAAVTRRIAHWMQEHPDTRVVAMSGTITKRSLLDFVHLVRWCLPESLQPLPRSSRELEAWASAVDIIKPHENRMQGGIGALARLCSPEELREGRNGVRSAVRRRIQETPGVVGTQAQEVDASLNIVLTKIDGYSERTHELARGLLERKKPNGDVITARDLGARWRLFRTITSGFWYEWEPRPPKGWLKRRRAWKWVVNNVLDEHIPGLESEALVAKAALNGRLDRGEKEYRDWHIIRDTYKPTVVPVWEDDRMLQAIAAWARAHQGIVWVSEVALGQKLEQDWGLSYYHELGLNSRGQPIEKAIPEMGSIVASVSSNSEGRNLQAWNQNLVISPPPTGNVWEQLMGRTHRPGQEADEVWVEVFFGCRVEWECWLQAMRDAEYASKIEAPKRLTYATIERTFNPMQQDGTPLWPVG